MVRPVFFFGLPTFRLQAWPTSTFDLTLHPHPYKPRVRHPKVQKATKPGAPGEYPRAVPVRRSGVLFWP
jgi:hypothetical protein